MGIAGLPGMCAMRELRESRTLAGPLRHQARQRPERTALRFGDRATSYGEFDRRADRIASGLAGLGVRRGDRVGYLGKNSDLYFELLFGAARAGAALVPVNWRLAAPEIAAILADAGVTTLFLGRGYEAAAEAPGMPAGLRCVSMAGPGGRWPGFEAWRDAQPAADPGAPVEAEDTAIQMYTSGTTGLPKGVELSHRNHLATLEAMALGRYGDIPPEAVVLVCMPVFHVAGTNVGLLGLTRGAEVVVMEEFSPAGLADAIPRHGVAWLLLVPAAILALLEHPAAAGADFGSVRTLAYGASPIAEALMERAGRAFARATLWQLYGLTEATGAGTILPPEAHDPARGKPRSCGLPYPGFELRVVDPLGEPVPTGAVGELVLRSATVMKGYWNNPEATRAAFFPSGWLRTGDAAYLDEEGFVYVYDRVKDMVISGGENVYPAEVEAALADCPGVAEVVVVGVRDERWGEVGRAFVVLRPEVRQDEQGVVRHARSRLAGYKVPRQVVILSEIPRLGSGKPDRRALAELR
jgi:acyl-CoA synthetase (AMP-forming)/AMP-acid ligase II